MNTTLNRRNRLVTLGTVMIAVLLLASFAGVGIAYADDGEQPDPGSPGDRIDERLETFLERLNEWHAIQDENLGKANNAIDRVEELLAKAEDLGIDTSEIQALMPDLYAAVGRAGSAHDSAGEILDEHAGFNGGGKVKDRQQAIETLRSAYDSLESAKNSLLEARDIVQQIIEIAKELRQNYIRADPAISTVS
jgi:hypothetical protein